MSDYTDLTTQFGFNDLIAWQQFDELGENDNYIRGFYANYRRPVLVYVSATQLDVENNTGTANQTKIVFPDGIERSVTEDTSGAHKYRRFDITSTSNFITGTEDSGLRSGLSTATNTWFAIYAVKSQIDSSKFVLSGDTILPIQSNVQSINSVYGANSWVYIGLISQASNVITDFIQSGNKTILNEKGGAPQGQVAGIVLAQGLASDTATYTTVFGTGVLQVPNNVGIFDWFVTALDTDPIPGVLTVTDKDVNVTYFKEDTEQTIDFGFQFANIYHVESVSSSVGLKATTGGASGATITIGVTAWVDHALGVGFNPLF